MRASDRALTKTIWASLVLWICGEGHPLYYFFSSDGSDVDFIDPLKFGCGNPAYEGFSDEEFNSEDWKRPRCNGKEAEIRDHEPCGGATK